MARRLAWVCLAGLWAEALAAADRVMVPPVPPTPQVASADDLGLAAACLDRGEETAAASYLTRHLVAHPDRSLVRFSLAELLWRRERFAEAATEYEQFLRGVPPQPANLSRLVQAHTRLISVAQQTGDVYGEHLHRGIGLFLLADQDGSDTEALLCQAAGELTLAVCDRPAEARPHWYLHLIWSRLGQTQPAERHRSRAVVLARFCDLCPFERCALSAGSVDSGHSN